MINIKVNPKLGLLEAAEAADLLERRLAVAANNLANVSTVAFKKDRLSFREVLMEKYDGELRTFKEVTEVTDFQHGPLIKTDNPFDIAIVGEGFFKVETPEGVRYTRDGSFVLDDQYRLVTKRGYPVLAGGAPVILQGEEIAFAEDGSISVDGAIVGQLDIVRITDLKVLVKEGHNLFRLDDPALEEAIENPQVRTGYLEGSNVNPLQEMLALIDIQRQYEFNQKAIQQIDELDGRLLTEAGRTA
ncbi:flagellar basal-body rod protein FlgF [Thermosulfuriphilus sp.]